MLLYTGHMLFRAVLFVSGTRDRPPAPELPAPDDALPVYTLVVALYREANMAEQIVGAMMALRYPAKKLDLIFALEPDDHDTIKAIRAAMPAHARIVLARGAAPKAKPRALNAALTKARGEFLAIYDAEDRPDPDQLLKAVAALKAGPPELACVQAELRPDDARPNVLQRLFALDFCLWFEVMLWGLERQSMPVPLGGTSNHFRTAILRQAGGWDSFNVTEDADLGLRLARLGYKTGIIASQTREESPSSLKDWMLQRRRWIRGYMQTLLVHMRPARPPVQPMNWRFSAMLYLFVGGSIAFGLLNPLFWTIFLVHQLAGFDLMHWAFGSFVEGLATLSFGLGNTMAILLAALSAVRRRDYQLAAYAALMPLYWVLISAAAYGALITLIRSPFIWEKTPHRGQAAA